MKLKRALITAALASGMASQAHAAVATFITSAPYSQFSDSPFFAVGNGNPDRKSVVRERVCLAV